MDLFAQVLPSVLSHLPSSLKTSKSLVHSSCLGPTAASLAQKAVSPMVSFSAKAGPSSEGQQMETSNVLQRCCAGLTFVLDDGTDTEDWDSQYALTTIAQVEASVC